MDTNIFYPEQGGSCSEAKAVCFACPLDARGRCLREALERVEPYGIWGGTSERQRRKLKQHQNLSNTELLALADRTSGGPEREPKRPKPALVVPPGYKRCKDESCRAVLPLETGFNRDSKRTDGHAIYCKACASRKAQEVKARRSPEAREAARERNRQAQRARYRARKAS